MNNRSGKHQNYLQLPVLGAKLTQKVLLTGVLSALLATTVNVHAITPEALVQYKQAMTFLRLGDTQQAEQALRLSIGMDPSDSLSYLQLSQLVEKKGHLDEAISLCNAALQSSPNDVMIHQNLARLFEAKQLPAEALKQYDALVTVNPWQYPYAYLSIARLQARINNPALAVAAYQRFLTAYPNHPQATSELARLTTSASFPARQPDFYTPPQVAAESVMNLPQVPQTAQVNVNALQQAQQLEKQGNLAQALDLYKQAVVQQPELRPNLYLTIAEVAKKLNNAPEALAALQTYQQYDAKNATVERGIGELALKVQDFPLAVRQFSNAVNLTNSDVQKAAIRQQLAYSLQMNREYSAAAAQYQQLLDEPSLANQIPQLKQNLALAYQQSGQLEPALALYKEITASGNAPTSLKQDMGQTLIALADQAAGRGQVEQAKQYLSQSNQVAPQLAELAQPVLVKINAVQQQQVSAQAVATAPSAGNNTTVATGSLPISAQQALVPAKPSAQGTYSMMPYGVNPPGTNRVENSEFESRVQSISQKLHPNGVSGTAVATAVKPSTLISSSSMASVPASAANLQKVASGQLSATTLLAAGAGNTTVGSANSTTQLTTQPPVLDSDLKSVQQMIAQKQYQQAITALESLHQKRSPSVASYSLLTQAHQGLGHKVQAAQTIEQALKLDPNQTTLLSQAGDLYRQLNEYKQAERNYSKLTQVEPENDKAWYQLGVVQHLSQSYPQSIASFRKATFINPKSADAHYGLGVAYEANKQYEYAITSYENYLKLANKNSDTAKSIQTHLAQLHNYLTLIQQKPAQKTPQQFNVEGL